MSVLANVLLSLFSFCASKTKTCDESKTENLPQGLREGRSLWRDGKTKPVWYQGRHDSSKQETHSVRGGIPSRLRDREEVNCPYSATVKGRASPPENARTKRMIPWMTA